MRNRGNNSLVQDFLKGAWGGSHTPRAFSFYD